MSACIFCLFFLTKFAVSQKCPSKIYCESDFLRQVQLLQVYNDSKRFLDTWMIFGESGTLRIINDFLKKHPDPTKADLEDKIKELFFPEEKLDGWTPPDFNDNPSFLARITDKRLRKLGKDVVALWPTLGRKLRHYVNTSNIYVPNGFIIPGGMWTEFYYWDTYWIICGLLITEMDETVLGILENFIHLIKTYGFIPRCGRVYCLDRSLPPLFTMMVAEYVTAKRDLTFLKEALPHMDTELSFWLNKRTVTFNVRNGKWYTLAIYNSSSKTPRPEWYRNDYLLCSILNTTAAVEKCYHGINSASESGTIFSSRWTFDDYGAPSLNMSLINPERIVPVELNTILAKSFELLSQFYHIFGNEKKSKFWDKKAKQWLFGIEKTLYNKQDGIWYDYDIKRKRKRNLFISTNFFPLWAELFDKEEAQKKGKKALEYLKAKFIDKYLGGFPTTLIRTSQKWDFPNAAPPLQEVVILGLFRSGYEPAMQLARSKAYAFLDSILIGLNSTGQIFDFYDAVIPGKFGGRGEYTPQSGFGWTNGVILMLLNTFSKGVKQGPMFGFVFFVVIKFLIKNE